MRTSDIDGCVCGSRIVDVTSHTMHFSLKDNERVREISIR